MAADTTAKAALCLQISNSQVLFSDFKPLIVTHVNEIWQYSWDTEINNNFHKVQPYQPVIKSLIVYTLPRKDEVVIHRPYGTHASDTFTPVEKRTVTIVQFLSNTINSGTHIACLSPSFCFQKMPLFS